MYAAGFSLLTGNWCAVEDQVEKTHPVSDCWCFFHKRDGIAAVQTIQSFFLLFLTDHLVHSLVRDHRGNSQMLSEDYRQIVRRHEAVGDVACRTVVVRVNLLTAHAVGHRQGSVGLEQAGKKAVVSTSPQRIVTRSCKNFALAISAIFGEMSIPVTEATFRFK